MPRKQQNLIGKRYGRLIVVKDSGLKTTAGATLWECLCECGKSTRATRSNLGGKTKSCGCLSKEMSLKRIDEVHKMTAVISAKCGTNPSQLQRKLQINNKSGVKGVYFHKQKQKWCAVIGYRRKQINLGYFKDINDAITARKEAEEKYFKPVLEKYASEQ